LNLTALNIKKFSIYIHTSAAAAAAENFINCLRQRQRRLENLKVFSVIGSGSAARLTSLIPPGL
jgi:hypothetical protein